MLYRHFTGASAINAVAQAAKRVRITINTGFTGTLTISDETGIAGSPVVGIITNPVVGQFFDYWGIQSGLTITPSGTGADATVNADFSRSGT